MNIYLGTPHQLKPTQVVDLVDLLDMYFELKFMIGAYGDQKIWPKQYIRDVWGVSGDSTPQTSQSQLPRLGIKIPGSKNLPKNHHKNYQKTYEWIKIYHTNYDNSQFTEEKSIFSPFINLNFQRCHFIQVFEFTFAYIWKTQFVKVITYHIISSNPGKFDMGSTALLTKNDTLGFDSSTF